MSYSNSFSLILLLGHLENLGGVDFSGTPCTESSKLKHREERFKEGGVSDKVKMVIEKVDKERVVGGGEGGKVVRLSPLPAAASRGNMTSLCREMGEVEEVQVGVLSFPLTSTVESTHLTTSPRWCMRRCGPSRPHTPWSPSPRPRGRGGRGRNWRACTWGRPGSAPSCSTSDLNRVPTAQHEYYIT